MSGVEVLIPCVECPNEFEFTLGSIDLDEDVTVQHGDGNNKRKMTAQWGSGIGMTVQCVDSINKKKMTAQRGSGIGMTVQHGDSMNNNEMTAQWGSSIGMTVQGGDSINKNEMTVQCGDSVRKNVYKTMEQSGIDMIAKGSGTNEMKLYWESKSGFNERGNTNSE